MHALLEKLFTKRGIDDTTKLTDEEKVVYDKWQKILSEGDITVEKIAEFCEQQINVIENKWQELDNSQRKNERLILLHTVYKTIWGLITKPRAEKESLERYLNSLLQE